MSGGNRVDLMEALQAALVATKQVQQRQADKAACRREKCRNYDGQGCECAALSLVTGNPNGTTMPRKWHWCEAKEKWHWCEAKDCPRGPAECPGGCVLRAGHEGPHGCGVCGVEW